MLPETVTDKKVCFIQYNSCRSWNTYPASKFFQDVADTISSQTPEKVIVDLRYNSGGNSSILEPLIDTLASLQKKQEFTLDVLIGSDTFSSALINAVHLDQRTDCRLAGTPTGGSVNHYGEILSFTLKNSGIPVYYSTKYFVMDPAYPTGSLMPELYTERTLADLIAGRDTQVAACLSPLSVTE
jgi:hypothetical protein